MLVISQRTIDLAIRIAVLRAKLHALENKRSSHHGSVLIVDGRIISSKSNSSAAHAENYHHSFAGFSEDRSKQRGDCCTSLK